MHLFIGKSLRASIDTWPSCDALRARFLSVHGVGSGVESSTVPSARGQHCCLLGSQIIAFSEFCTGRRRLVMCSHGAECIYLVLDVWCTNGLGTFFILYWYWAVPGIA